MRRLCLIVLTIIVAIFLGQALSPSSANVKQKPNTVASQKLIRHKKAIKGQYIVVLNTDSSSKDGNLQVDIDQLAGQIAYEYQGTVINTYSNVFKGFTAQLSEQDAQQLSQDARVKFIEADVMIPAASPAASPADNGDVAPIEKSAAALTQNGVGWNLDRIDQRQLPLNGSYSYNETGAGVNVYLLNSGIRTTHQDFSDRASIGYDAVNDGQNGNDCYGLGTHVAGIVGGNSYGVAKGANLIAVRVMGCNGGAVLSNIIAGIDWVTANHVKPAVANIGLSTIDSTTLDMAVTNSINAGVSYVIQAGNANKTVSSTTASLPSVITVSSSTASDSRASTANIGDAIDIFAPGDNITSTGIATDTTTFVNSGTQQAAAHVTGAAALFLQAKPNALPSEVEAGITGNATTNKLTNAGAGSPNLLLYTPNIAANRIGLDKDQMNFTGVAGDPNPAAQTVTIRNLTGGSMNYTTSSNASWLTANKTSGSAPDTVSISCNTAGLAPGSYTGRILFNSTGATNYPAVSVTLTINPITFTVSTNEMRFSALINGGNPGSQELRVITNSSRITWTANNNANWLNLSTSSGTSNGTITVSANKTGLPLGQTYGKITITPNSSLFSPIEINSGIGIRPNNSLVAGQRLTATQAKSSLDGKFSLKMQLDGNLVLYNLINFAMWSSGTNAGRNNNSRLDMQFDGNLCVRNYYDEITWASNTYDNPGAYAIMQNDGNLVIYAFDGVTALWSSGTWVRYNRLNPNETLYTGQHMLSDDHKWRLTMQKDGNLVFYNSTNQALWDSNTDGNSNIKAVMQDNGDLVLRRTNGSGVWASDTFENGGSSLVIESNGVLAIYDNYNNANYPIWSSNWHAMPTVSDTLPSRFNMPPGMHLFSKNRQYNLKMRDTGNLALYNTAGQLLWESGTSGGSYNNVRVVMQDNGDMVLRRLDNGSAVYASDTDGNPGAYLKVLDDGSIRIYATDGSQLWSRNQ